MLEDLFEGVEMADSEDKQKDNSADDFTDDLDAMLKDAESSMEDTDELVDDDVIDRLLMDDSFDPTEENNKDNSASDKQVDSNIEGSTTDSMNEKQQNDNIDEFGDEDEFDVDSLLSEATGEVADEEDEFVESEISNSIEKGVEANNSPVEDKPEESEDEFDIDDLIDSTSANEDDELEVEGESAKDDFLMADFDISADGDDELEELNETDELEEEIEVDELEVEVTETPAESAINNEAAIDFKKELDAQNVVVTKATEDLANANKTMSELRGQVSQIVAENESLKGLVNDLTSVTTEKNDAAAEEIDSLQKEQRKLRKAIKDSESKVPIIVYVVMGIAILALFVGGGLGAIGYGAKTDVESLTELVSSLEEEIEIMTTKDSTSDIREIKFNINQLKIKDEGVDEQLLGLLKQIQQPKTNSLQAVVDDLMIQNSHAQKAIEKLLASVEILEQNAVVTAAARKKSLQARKAHAQVRWVVNLVSFKQEWYAKRKAEEFKKKGISAKVEQVKVNGEQWFRLRVKGFKSKYEAAAYAVKVKKILNLSSVWVTKI